MFKTFSKWLSRNRKSGSCRPSARRALDLESLEDRITPTVNYGFAIGGGATGSAEAWATTTDNSGNIYVTGSYGGSVAFGNTTLTSHGTFDAFVAKYSSTGSLEWVADLAGVSGGNASGYGIAVDSSGNVYTTGQFKGTNVNFDPNSSSHQLSTSHNGSDYNAYVSKLNAAGQYVFAVDLGSGGTAEGTGIALDGSDSVYTTGEFEGTNLNFDPNGSKLFTSASVDNAYVSKLNSSGHYVYAEQLGSGGTAVGNAIAVDSIGDAYTTGNFSGTNVNFDPNSSGHQLSNSAGSNYNAYVSKLSPTGTYLWAVDLGYGGSASGGGIALDISDDVYTTGFFYGSNENFDPNSSFHQLSSSDSGIDLNSYVSKLSSSGQYIFAVDVGYGGMTYALGLALDSQGDVYTTGNFQGNNVNFDPYGDDQQLSTSNGGNANNAYVSELNSSGQYVFAVDLGYGATSQGNGIAVDGSSSVYTVGYLKGANADFNPFGTQSLSSPVGADALFLSKLTQSFYQSNYAEPAYDYTYYAYIYAFDAYVGGTGSYSAFLYEYYADVYATNAYTYAQAGDQTDAESNGYYAYYYGYFGQ